MAQNTMDRLIPPEDLAAELGIPVKTLGEWRSRGTGPTYLRLGRHVRYRRDDVDRWLAGRVRQPGEGAGT